MSKGASPAATHRTDPGATVAVTVIIVSFNTRNLVVGCIASVLRDATVPLEIVVVDNASADGTADAVRARFPDVSVIANQTNRGFAAANNQGLAVARGRYALLLNPDTEVLPGAIESCVRFADANPDAGIVGCRVLNDDGSQQPTLFRTMRLRYVLVDVLVPIRVARKVKLLGRQRYSGLDLDRVHDVETVTGCFMLARRAAWERAGVLDEDFFIYGEESEWCWRIRRAGWKVRYHPGASIVHRSGASTVQVRTEMNLSLTRSLLLLVQKTQGRPAAYAANAMLTLREAPRAALFRLFRLFGVRCSDATRVSLEHSAARFVMHVRGLGRFDWRAEARRPPFAAAPSRAARPAASPPAAPEADANRPSAPSRTR